MKVFCFLFLFFIPYSWGLDSKVNSPYTAGIDKINFNQIESFIGQSIKANDLISLNCYTTSDDKYYIGLFHGVLINDTLKNVANVLEDFANYSRVFHGVEEAKIVKKSDENNLIVQFEDKAPAFFLPNTRYQMFYTIERNESRQLYKYHLSNLLKQNDLLFSDGLIFLKEDHGKTFYYELDFFKAKWGIAEKLASSKIWPESIKELVISDFELKLKVENKDLSLKDITLKSKKMFNEDDIKTCANSAVDQKEFFKNFH